MTGVPEVVAVITIVSGRHRHLRRQLEAFAHSTRRPDLHFVVAMDDPDITSVTDGHPVEVIRFANDDADTLQLADARNAGATAAMTAGASLLLFLNVDCIPSPDMLERYLRSCTATPDLKALYCGPVTYLPCDQPTFDARELARFTDPHPARPSPGSGQTQLSSELMLFWSLSFAVRATDWLALGGFHPGYRGYGGEDTDFAMSARDNGFRIAWVGGAHAYHQHHPVSNPPVEHLADILRNARVFHRRWGTWPMEGWLRAFADRGLVSYDAAGDEWLRVSDGTSRTR